MDLQRFNEQVTGSCKQIQSLAVQCVELSHRIERMANSANAQVQDLWEDLHMMSVLLYRIDTLRSEAVASLNSVLYALSTEKERKELVKMVYKPLLGAQEAQNTASRTYEQALAHIGAMTE